jgi:hypothetical protein
MTVESAASEDNAKDERPRASLRQMVPEFQRNGLTHVAYFTQATHHPNDLFAYGREAFKCFMERRYLATIMMASAVIEVTLNKDSRMRTPTGVWRTLSMKLLRLGKRNGLPIDRLLEPGESLQAKSIAFLNLRNRIAHGNLAGLIGFEHRGTPDYSPEARDVALKHLSKTEQFEVDWYNTAPDVQDRRITGGSLA